jgi:uncharacterized protein (DUF885 family)
MYKKHQRLLLILVAILATTTHGLAAPTGTPPPRTTDPAFRAFLDKSFTELTQPSAGVKAAEVLTRLQAWPADALSAGDRLDQEAFGFLLGDWETNSLGPTLRIPEALPTPLSDPVQFTLINYRPLRREADITPWLDALKEIPGQFDAALATLAKQAAAGHVLPRMVLSQMASTIDWIDYNPPAFCPLAQHFNGQLAAMPGLDAATAAKSRDRAAFILERIVYPAYRSLRRELRAAAAAAPEGLSLFIGDEGRQGYDGLVRAHAGQSIDAQALHAQAMADIAALGARLDALAPGPGLPFEKGFAFLKDEPASGSDDRAWANGVLESARAEAARLTSLPLPEFEVRFGTNDPKPNYVHAIPDGSQPAHLNFPAGSVCPGSASLGIIWHEGLPGHALQLGVQQANAALPLFRRYCWSPVFVEGWATYAEDLMAATAEGDNVWYRARRLLDRYSMALKVAVDTGINGFGWSYKEAQSFLLKYQKSGSAAFNSRINWAIYEPGKYFRYYCGERWITSLRAEAMKLEGPGFDQKAFHDRLLSAGWLPPELLRREVLTAGTRPR